MPTNTNFLQQGVKQVRKSIRDIDDSYNNDWDIIAELVQNSVDAIRKAKQENGEIEVTVDSQNKTIIVKDNGIGIAPDQLPILLAPFATDKEDDESAIGEKGVGLTFVLFSCNDFHIKSGNVHGASEASIKDAYNWKISSTSDFLPLTYGNLDESLNGTQVTLKKVAETPLFDLSFNQLEYVLRTKTAIGNTNTIWGTDIKINVLLTHINQDGTSHSKEVDFKYWLPIENIDNYGKIDIKDFYEYIKKDRTDQDKRKKLKDKIVYKTVIYDYNGRSVKAFACFVPKRRTWNDLTRYYSIATEEQLANEEWIDKYYYSAFYSGIFSSVKGMPTGVTIDHPITGAQGAWPQLYILFEDRRLKFDIGRKAIHGMQARIYKNFAKEIFSEFQRLAKYISGEVIMDRDWEKEEIFAEIDKLLDLDVKGILLKKTPREQEASVAGLFFECLGNKIIKDIYPLVSGYRNKYDLYAMWGNKKIVIEFKSKLQNILKDFNDETKLFNEINCIVCWDVTESDQQCLANKGIDLEEISYNSLPGTVPENIPSSTHKISLSGFVAPIYVIDLKKVIKA